jgi:hypothetical protein
MNQAKVLGTAIVLAAIVVGCSSSAADDKLMEEMLAHQEKILELKQKNDEASAAEVKKLQEKVAELSKKIDALSAERREAMKKKYQAKADALAEKEKNLPTPEDRLMEDMLAQQQKMVDLLQKQKLDADSLAEMKKVQERLKDISKKIAALPPEKALALQQKWMPKLQAIQEKLMKGLGGNLPKVPQE